MSLHRSRENGTRENDELLFVFSSYFLFFFLAKATGYESSTRSLLADCNMNFKKSLILLKQEAIYIALLVSGNCFKIDS